MKMLTETVQARISADHLRILREHAKERGISLSELVRQVLDVYVLELTICGSELDGPGATKNLT